MVLPSNVTYGTVVGRFLIATADTPDDVDRDPQGVPASDLKITFSPDLSRPVARDPTATPPTFFALADVTATVGADGSLLGPDGQAGVKLVASTNPALDPSGWTWQVKMNGSGYPNIQQSFLLDGGSTVDLATVLQVPANPGTTLGSWLQAVADAQAARDAAVAAAASVPSATELAATYATKADTGQYGYLVTTFLGNGASLEKLSVFYSPNGKAVVGGGINPVFAPTGGVRDPSALYINGVWHVAYTANEGNGTTFGVAHSADLISWTNTVVDVSAVSGLTKTWAPELVRDSNGDVYCFFVMNASSVVYVKATTADLTAWSAVSGLSWTVPPSYAIIDPTFAHDGTTWRMFYKNEPAAMIERASSTSLTGTWTIDKTGDWAGWGSGIEGPGIINDHGTWRIYVDRFAAGTGYAYSESADLNTWTPLTTVPSPAGVTLRHGCFVPILDSAQFATAIGASMAPSAPGGWQTPTWQNGYTGNLEYRITKYGIQFRGFLTNSGGTAMTSGGEVLFLIPELQAHHPTRDQQMICASDAGGTVRVQFGSGGDVAKFEVTGSVTNLFLPPLINID